MAKARIRVNGWWVRSLGLAIALWMLWLPLPAIAALDPYVAQYLKVTETTPATLPLDASGASREFAYAELVQGKKQFEQTCLACHVGGATLANPAVSLSLANLQAATPPRDTIAALVTYMRHPLTYDGQDESFDCREISPNWLSDAELEAIAGFVLRAAQVAPGWGTSQF